MKDEETKLQHVTFGLKLSFFLLPSSYFLLEINLEDI